MSGIEDLATVVVRSSKSSSNDIVGVPGMIVAVHDSRIEHYDVLIVRAGLHYSIHVNK